MPVLPSPAARRLFLHKHLLTGTPEGDLAGLVETLGFVQLDSVNPLARAHDNVGCRTMTVLRGRYL